MLPSIIVLLVIALAVGLAVRSVWKRHKTGSCCGGTCAGCDGACGKPVKK